MPIADCLGVEDKRVVVRVSKSTVLVLRMRAEQLQVKDEAGEMGSAEGSEAVTTLLSIQW